MAEQDIQFKGLVVDAGFTPCEVTHYCIDHNISILGRTKSSSSVNFNGKTLKLSDLASLFPPKVCHYTAEVNWRSKRIPVERGGRNVDIVIIYRKEHGVWRAFFLVSTFPSEAVSLGKLLRAWKARWGIDVIHRLVKQNLSFGKCRYRDIRAHQNWAALIVQAFHAILDVRKRHPELNWRAAQRQAAQKHLELVRTALFPSSCVLEAV
ncbi:hypothetical protein ACI3L1_08020 [Deinococcus sp. SM5_A1]|uniref:hypothetical protein n=1 Tax=Deinococcus sp. SM5_A1 TaxID=3379094 RepID=UPI00385BCEFF